MSDPPASHGIEIRIDRHVFRIDKQVMTGAELRRLATPEISRDVDLIQASIEADESDLLIADDQLVDLENGTEFFTVPRAILAGSSTDNV